MSVHDEAGFSSEVFSSQQASAQEAILVVEGPSLNLGRGFAVASRARVSGV